MAKYRLQPNVLQKLYAVMRVLRILPLKKSYSPEIAAQNRSRFFMTPVKRRRGDVAWFKGSLQDSVFLERSLAEEMNVQRGLADFEKRYHPEFDSPSFIAGQDTGHFRWLLRKYWVGAFAGDMDHLFGFSTKFLKVVGPKKMARIMADVRSMTPFMKRRTKFFTHDLSWYLLDFRYYKKHFWPKFFHHRLNPGIRNSDVLAIERELRTHRKFFKQRAKTFSHGDMYPNNIMLRDNGRVVLFDWELSHLNLPTFDLVMVYLQAWRNPTWQAAFKKESWRLLGNPKQTEVAWRLAMLSLATRLTAFGFLRLTNGQPDRYPPLPRRDLPTMRRMYRHHLKHLQELVETL